MGWFSRKKEMRPAWEYRATGQIWRLVPSLNGYMIGEDREVGDRKVSFFSVDLESGKERWRIRFSEDWWIGIEAVDDDYLFVHEYASPDMPEHKKIHTVDARSGKILWSDENLKYMYTENGLLYAQHDSAAHRTFVEAEIRSGKIVRELDEQFVVSAEKPRAREISERIQYPRMVGSGGNHPSPVKECLEIISKNNQVPAFTEIVLNASTVMVGFYRKLEGNPGGFRQEIGCYTIETKKMAYRDLVNEQTSFPLPDTFLIVDSVLYYVKMKQSLTAVNIQS